MPDEIKDAVVPVVTPETAAAEPIIVNPREALESAVITENETIPDIVLDEPAPVADAPEESKELSQVERIKQSVQKRIDKVVAKQKSAEEKLAEAEAEIARLRATPHTATEPVKDGDLSSEQIKNWMIQEAKNGTLTMEQQTQALILLADAKEREAVKSVEDRQKKVTLESNAKAERESKALQDLAKDYIVYGADGQPDMKSDMTLANQKGKLFQTAIALYNDPELRAQFYNDPDRALGLRRAVQDANRELHAQGLVTPKVEPVGRINRQVLADPDATEVVETPTNTALLSDADKVRAEILSRNRMRNSRQVSK